MEITIEASDRVQYNLDTPRMMTTCFQTEDMPLWTSQVLENFN
jgi:hypothetical protein